MMNWELYVIQGMELSFLGIGSYLDLKDQSLPTLFLGMFAAAAMLCQLFFGVQKTAEVLAGIGMGAAVLIIGKLTEEAIGYGDGMVILILGMLEGVSMLFRIVFGALILSGIYSVCKILADSGSVKERIPFLPFLFLAFVGVRVL